MIDKENIPHIPFDDAPEEWFDRCSGDGYDKYTNEYGERVYSDNDIVAGELGFRPCARCGRYPSLDGDDACLSNLGRVMNACCGHGKNKGYIQFDNGITVRGDFEIERHDSFPMDYEMKSRKEIFDRMEELENNDEYDVSHIELKALKWVMGQD